MERIMLKKGDVIRTFNKQGNKIIATLEVGGAMVSNPTLSMMYADGWEDYTPPTPPPYEPTAKELIQQEIRERYDDTDEWMINRRMNDALNPESTMTEAEKEAAIQAFNEYNEYVEAVLAKYENE